MKNHTPLISIVLTLYNKGNYIEDQLFSIHQQTYPHWELIIVDDCSTDGSFEKAKQFCEKLGISSKCTFLQNKENVWVSKTFEHGLQYVKGEYVAMADADDIWMKNKLEVSLQYFQYHPETEFIYGDLTTIDENNTVISTNFYKNSILLSLANKICPYPMAVTSSILFSTKPLKELLKIGFPDRKRNICQDYRVSHFFVCWYGWAKIAYIDTPLAYYRRAPGAISLGKKTKEGYKGVKTQIMQLAIYIYEINNFIMKQINHLSLKWDLSTKNGKNTLKIKFHYFRWCGQ